MPEQRVFLADSGSRQLHYQQRGELACGSFKAMATPCEILLESKDQSLLQRVTQLAAAEAWRVEEKFSRYRSDNLIHTINQANAAAIRVDEETARLLDFAAQCYALSDGLFDITSGVLRRAWKFDRSDRVPSVTQVQNLLPLVGWHKVNWQSPVLQMPEGMELDLGGLGKEYAVDRVAQLLMAVDEIRVGAIPLLVNFGGDLLASRPRAGNQPWRAGIAHPNTQDASQQLLYLSQGALATSGDAYRYLLKDGRRFSHVLNPKTGWPVEGGPSSVTVAADTCIQAGMLSTMALLAGAAAEQFLQAQGVRYWCVW